MANVSSVTSQFNAPNYIGELFKIGQNRTTFLNAIGGIDGANLVQSSSFQFPLNQQYSLESASQPDISETDSFTAPTPTTFVRSQDTNVCQIFQKKISVSYQKQSHVGLVSGLANVDGSQPVRNERDFQVMANLKQMAVEMEYTFLEGTYQLGSNTSTSYQTRGIVTACTTNTVDASDAAFSKSLMDQLLRSMFDSGAEIENGNCIIFCSPIIKQAISEVYGLQERRDGVGGVVVNTVLTDLGELEVRLTPYITASTLLVADVEKIRPVVCPVPGKGYLFEEELSKAGASEDLQLYSQMGIDYSAEEFHGTITNLATS